MQGNTSGDQYSFTLVESDGVTPLPVAGVTSIVVEIGSPGRIALISTVTPVVLSGNVASFVTTQGPPPTFAKAGGIYHVQFALTYTGGAISKSRVYPITILPSLV